MNMYYYISIHSSKQSLYKFLNEFLVWTTGIAAEQKKNEKKVALEADAALTKLDDLVLGKRNKAQLLMEVADKVYLQSNYGS